MIEVIEGQDSSSIASRFSASLIFTILRGVINLVTGFLIARWLGSEDYGRMAFMLATFLAFRQLIDMSSTSAFFTFLSQRQRSRNFIRYYWYWVGIQFFLSFVIVALVLPSSLIESIWMGESRLVVILALTAVFMQSHVWVNTMQMAEAQRRTVSVHKINTFMVFLHLVLLSILWLFDQLILPLIFTALIIEWMIAGLLASKLYRNHEHSKDKFEELHDTALSTLKEFWNYCAPFIPYVWLSFAYTIADRWLLQHWGGAKEQAYFSIALQFSAVALLATTSILRIFWKEVAEAKQENDFKKIKKLYNKTSRRVYFFGAFLSAAILPWASEIVMIVLGEEYLESVSVFFLMLLYPVHQTMGQIGSTMLFATENSKIQVQIGLWFMASSMIFVYFMLAPQTMFIPGFEMGAEGLAIKMIIMQLIQVNVIAWFISKIFHWKYNWIYQFAIMGLLGTLAVAVKLLVTSIFDINVIMLMLSAFFLYSVVVLLVIFAAPGLVETDKKTIKSAVSVFNFHNKV